MMTLFKMKIQKLMVVIGPMPVAKLLGFDKIYVIVLMLSDRSDVFLILYFEL